MVVPRASAKTPSSEISFLRNEPVFGSSHTALIPVTSPAACVAVISILPQNLHGEACATMGAIANTVACTSPRITDPGKGRNARVSRTLRTSSARPCNSALEAIESRGFWSAYPEVPSGKIYGETAVRMTVWLVGRPDLAIEFEIDQPGTVEWVGAEVSPYGIDTGTLYPKADLDVLMPAAVAAMASWKRADVRRPCGRLS